MVRRATTMYSRYLCAGGMEGCAGLCSLYVGMYQVSCMFCNYYYSIVTFHYIVVSSL